MDNEILKYFENYDGVTSMYQISQKIGMKFETFKRKAKDLGVYVPNRGGKGTIKSKRSLFDIFSNKVKIRSSELRERLIKEGLKERKCEECEIENWNGKKIVFELDHIDGNNENNAFENLKILCPNCHSQTPTFRGRKDKGYLQQIKKIDRKSVEGETSYVS